MSQAVVFASMCAECRREQLQTSYSVASLQRLLQSGYPIEAYCASCDKHWPIGVQQRMELGEFAASGM